MRPVTRVSFRAAPAALLVFTLSKATTAQAAEVDVSFIVTSGQFRIGASDFPLPTDGTAGLTGTFDDATGEFEGETTFPPSQIMLPNPAPPGTLTINMTTTSESTGGTFDPDTGEITSTSILDITLEFVQLQPDGGGAAVPLGVTCTMADIEIDLSTSPDGSPYAPLPADPANEEGSFELAGSGFTVPEPTCTGANQTIVDLVRDGLVDRLGLPQSDTELVIGFETGEIQEAQPLPTVPPTAPPVAAPVAPAVVVPPTFTG
jgi:hypothetical protein